MTGSPWAVVLAGGDGDRVSSITLDAEGRTVPKQFWCGGGRAPMVRWALARARRISPVPRVLAVVREQHRSYWQRLLADVPRHNLLIQPENRGTAPGVLRALVEIEAREGGASSVVILPSDHYVGDEDVLHDALVTAVRASRREARSVVLLGVCPARAEAGYGWILPAAAGEVSPVEQFIEKPDAETAGRLLGRGALVNSFIIAARVEALMGVIGRALPDMLHAFRQAASGRHAGLALRRFYRHLPASDLSRDVLARTTPLLLVVRVAPCGWSDLGTPERLRHFLEWPVVPAGTPIPGTGQAAVA